MLRGLTMSALFELCYVGDFLRQAVQLATQADAAKLIGAACLVLTGKGFTKGLPKEEEQREGPENMGEWTLSLKE